MLHSKEDIVSEVSGLLPSTIESNYKWVIKAMDEYAKQEAISFSHFKSQYQLIESINVRHDQIENHGGNMYSWVGDSDDKIYEAYKNNAQLKRYFEK